MTDYQGNWVTLEKFVASRERFQKIAESVKAVTSRVSADGFVSPETYGPIPGEPVEVVIRDGHLQIKNLKTTTGLRIEAPGFTRSLRHCEFGSPAVAATDRPLPLSQWDAISPNHYQFPGGAEVRHISEWLTANAAQALQYIARSSRIDGQNKGDAAEDIRKAIRFLEFELERLDV